MQNIDPTLMIAIFSGIALMPLLLMITTCFLKMAIVLIIVRNALGVQQVPPTMAIYGIALALTVYVMTPVFYEMKEHSNIPDLETSNTTELFEEVVKASTPLKNFMIRHSHPDLVTTFVDNTKEIWPDSLSQKVDTDNIMVIIPAFVVSEIQSAFKIGFLIYLPFIIVELIVSNLLLALGMQMVSPMTFSMPLKILLFVLVDGWGRLLNSLVLSYL